jgi:HEPN domain-containing protein
MTAGELTSKWITKAENDLKIGTGEMKTENPVTDMVCFHMQQCAEKYLKAFLVFNKKPFRKTHIIAELIELCQEIDDDFKQLYDFEADSLTIYATEARYPDEFYFPTKEETTKCINIAKEVKIFVLNKLTSAGYKTE